MENFAACIVELYDRVLQGHISRFSVKQQAIIYAIQKMRDAYRPVKDWKNRENVPMKTDYDDASYRCAYLHKHAMCCTGMVHHFMDSAIRDSDIHYGLGVKADINICSLGGGPGSDALAISEVFHRYFNFDHCSIRIIDYFKKWDNVFASVIHQLRSRRYGIFEGADLSEYINYKYIQADLLKSFTTEVKQVIRNSDFVSMVYFISAAACCKTEKMIQEVFNCMQPGAYLLFIDNAGGGYLTMTQKAAKKCGMRTAFGPIKHDAYSEEAFSVKRYRYYPSQSKARVSVQIWLKPLEQVIAESGVLDEPELNFYSCQESLGRYTEPQKPHLMNNPRTEISVESVPENALEKYQNVFASELLNEEPELYFYSSQSCLGSDIEQQPFSVAAPRTEISVESVPKSAPEKYKNIFASEILKEQPKLNFYSSQSSLKSYIEQTPFLITPPRAEISRDLLPRNASEQCQPIAESENATEDKQECCCTIL